MFFWKNTRFKKTDSMAKRFKSVEPTKSLLLFPMPCETQAASIRNKAIQSINEQNWENVVYRYLQSKVGADTAYLDAAKFSCLSATFFWVLIIVLIPIAFSTIPGSESYRKYDDITQRLALAFLVLTLASYGRSLPASSNRLMYQETEALCMDAIAQQLDQEGCAKIHGLYYQSKQDYYGKMIKRVEQILQEHSLTKKCAL